MYLTSRKAPKTYKIYVLRIRWSFCIPYSYTAFNSPSPTEQFGELWTQVEIQNYLRKLERCMTEQVNKIWDPPPPKYNNKSHL